MKIIVWVLLILLIILHQDIWFWDDTDLILGFCPIGLAYHVVLSMAASIVWLLVTRFAWPLPPGGTEIEAEDRRTSAGGGSKT